MIVFCVIHCFYLNLLCVDESVPDVVRFSRDVESMTVRMSMRNYVGGGVMMIVSLAVDRFFFVCRFVRGCHYFLSVVM